MLTTGAHAERQMSSRPTMLNANAINMRVDEPGLLQFPTRSARSESSSSHSLLWCPAYALLRLHIVNRDFKSQEPSTHLHHLNPLLQILCNLSSTLPALRARCSL